MWFTLFSSFWGTVHREIPSWRRTQPGGFRRATSRQSRRATAWVRGEQEVAKWQRMCSVTELQISNRARALMLKGGLVYWRHVPYLAPALIFALRITSLPDRRWVTTTMMMYNGMYRMQAGRRMCARGGAGYDLKSILRFKFNIYIGESKSNCGTEQYTESHEL